MAGSDKKEQEVASSESVSGGAAPFVVQDPDVTHFILSGQPEGLIHKENLKSDQKTTITTFSPLPDPGETEYYALEWVRAGQDNWETFQQHSYIGGDPWVPLEFTIPKEFLLDRTNEGPFDLRYKHINAGQVSDYSNRVPIHIDKVPPNEATPPAKMTLTITPPITDATFATNDFIEGTIPAWSGDDQTGVKVMYGWMKGELPPSLEDLDFEGPIDVVPGQKVKITKAMIEAAGDGKCTGGYVLIDKAGNWIISEYELISVAMGPLPPAPLPKPTAADATGGELLRSDIVSGGVVVNVPQVANGKRTDTVVVKWENHEITPGTPVGDNPSIGFDIFMPWAAIWEQYGSTTVGVVNHSLSYRVIRGVESFSSDVETVKVNLSAAGPVKPLPEPEPGNDELMPVIVLGESNVPNVLIDTDENKVVNATIKLVAPLVNGDKYQFIYNGIPTSNPYVIDTGRDNVDDVIEIPLSWDDIRIHGPSDAMPAYYKLSNPIHGNHQEPDPHSTVEIKFLNLEMPEAEPQTDHPGGWLTCNHLRLNEAGTQWGFEWKIPANPHMQEGDDVHVEYNGFKDFANPVVDPTTKKTHTFTNITREQATDGIIWWVGDYATCFLPIWSKEKQSGKGEVKYSIEGKPAASKPTNTRIYLSQGEGSCNIPPNP